MTVQAVNAMAKQTALRAQCMTILL